MYDVTPLNNDLLTSLDINKLIIKRITFILEYSSLTLINRD